MHDGNINIYGKIQLLLIPSLQSNFPIHVTGSYISYVTAVFHTLVLHHDTKLTFVWGHQHCTRADQTWIAEQTRPWPRQNQGEQPLYCTTLSNNSYEEPTNRRPTDHIKDIDENRFLPKFKSCEDVPWPNKRGMLVNKYRGRGLEAEQCTVRNGAEVTCS